LRSSFDSGALSRNRAPFGGGSSNCGYGNGYGGRDELPYAGAHCHDDNGYGRYRCGVGSNAVASGATDFTALAVVAVAIAVQFPVLRVIGIEQDDLSGKDVLYIVFMTFALWFVSWGILLTTGA
jgi:hypothetical protein